MIMASANFASWSARPATSVTNRIRSWIDGLDLVEAGFHDLDEGKLLRSDQGSQFGRTRIVHIASLPEGLPAGELATVGKFLERRTFHYAAIRTGNELIPPIKLE